MPRLSVWMIRAALLQLGVGVSLGMLLLGNKGNLLNPGIWLLLGTHIEIMVFGWLVQLVLGVAFWILPRFAHEPRYGRVRLGWISFALLNLGIVMVIVSAWVTNTAHLQAVGRGIELVAAVIMVMILWPRVKASGV